MSLCVSTNFLAIRLKAEQLRPGHIVGNTKLHIIDSEGANASKTIQYSNRFCTDGNVEVIVRLRPSATRRRKSNARRAKIITIYIEHLGILKRTVTHGNL